MGKSAGHNYDKETILKLLYEGNLKVTFRKKDDTIRTMICTTKHEEISIDKFVSDVLKEEKTFKYDEDQIRVFDTEANGWRSFKMDSIIDIERL